MTQSPNSAAQAADEAVLRSAREPVRKVVFGVLFVAMLGITTVVGPMFGLIGGIAFALVSGAALTGAYKLTSRSPKALSSAYTAGATSCPKCSSMQTDQAYTRGSDDTEVLQWTCYACDHTWLATD